MKIHEDYFGLNLLQQGISHAEGIFQAGHEGASLQINDRVRLTGRQLSLIKPVSWRAVYVVSRPQHTPGPVMAVRGNRLHVLDNLAFVPDMVTSGKHVGSLVEELVGNSRSHAEASGRVFRVYHDQVDVSLLD